ncbi:MAG: hypothetical protein PUC82_04250 [bacterium]|nr:hypothetical protein [bacterium]
MSSLFQIGIGGASGGACQGLEPLVRIIKGVLKYVFIIIPIALLIFGIIDLGKAVISSDDKEIKAATSRLIKRIIYAVVIFLVPSIVSLVMNLVALGADPSETDTTSWASCWNSVYIVNK